VQFVICMVVFIHFLILYILTDVIILKTFFAVMIFLVKGKYITIFFRFFLM